MSEDIQFVRLGPDDASAVAALEARCFGLPWSEEQFRQAFEQDVFATYGLKKQDLLIAYVAVYHTFDELEILNIAVAPEYRRAGHGKCLLGLVLRRMAKMGILRSVLEVRPSNIAAIGLYSAYGYRQEGRRKAYYPDTGEDALVYVLKCVSPETSLNSDAGEDNTESCPA